MTNNEHRIILFAGGYRFGRCPLENLGPTAFWPVGRSSALESVIARLADQGVDEVVVYSDCHLPLSDTRPASQWPIRVKFILDPEVSGSGGMLRLAVDPQGSGRIILLPISAVSLPPIQELLDAHVQGGADLTLCLNPEPTEGLSEIYVCEPDIMEHIPEQGYWDIKERVIPELAVLRKKVRQVTLAKAPGCFHDRPSYLKAVCEHLPDIALADGRLRLVAEDKDRRVWAADDAQIHPKARFCGSVLVLDKARVAEDAVVVGPAVLGPGSSVEKAGLVAGSVLWDGAKVGECGQVQRCVVSRGAVVPAYGVSQDEVIVPQDTSKTQSLAEGQTTAMVSDGRTGHPAAWAAALAAVAAAYLWSFLPDLKDLWGVWQISEEYSSGMLVPLLAGYVLWCRRDEFKGLIIKPCIWGLALLVLAQGLRPLGLYYMYSSAVSLSIVLTVVALGWWIGGSNLLRRTWPVMAFLFLMLPWPHRVQAAITLPLQGWSTSSAVFGLELMGYDVLREGNVIHVGDTTVAVAEACNGLRMITAFVVISGLVVLLVQRTWWEKLLILISSLPIALICNTLRLVITSVAYTMVKGEQARDLFHRFGGYAMMPLALALVVGELWLLSRLVMQPKTEEGVGVVIRRRDRLDRQLGGR